MTDKIIMEELSKSFVETIANRSGYFNCSGRDYGVDLMIRKANLCPLRNRYLTTGKAVDIQLKSVSEKYVVGLNDPAKTSVTYSLEVKNYCDLIDRGKESGNLIPLILVLFILPDDQSKWLGVTKNGLIVRKRAYWYRMPATATYPTNKSTSVIKIPKANILTSNFFSDIFSTLD